MPFSSAPASFRSAAAATAWPRLRAWVRWHRQGVAAALGVLGLVLLARELRPPPPPTVAVVTAARDLASGSSVTGDDVRLARVPVGSVPDGALRAPPLGRLVALPVRRGEVITDVRVLGDGLLGALAPGDDMVAAPVHLADASTAALLRVGDTVDVTGAGAAGTATVAARAARVLVVPQPRGGSGLGATQSGSDGVVVLAVEHDEAMALARAAVLDRLSVVIRASP